MKQVVHNYFSKNSSILCETKAARIDKVNEGGARIKLWEWDRGKHDTTKKTLVFFA